MLQQAYTWPAQPAARRQYGARRKFGMENSFSTLLAKGEIQRQRNSKNLKRFYL